MLTTKTLNPTQFQLARISLIRGIGCPKELQGSVANCIQSAPIVVVENIHELGTTARYTPAAVIVAGAVVRNELLSKGINRSWAWVDKALTIYADDEIGSNELMQRLTTALNIRLYGSEQPSPNQTWPNIMEVYPFENYCIFVLDGQKYRQHYTLDPVARIVHLTTAEKVKEMFVNSQATTGASKEQMPRVQTGVRFGFAPGVANNQSTNRGAQNSELMTQLVRNWSNVLEAVAMYLSAIKQGLYKPMRPSFYPVDIADNKVGAVMKANGVSYIDFAMWSAMEQAKEQKTKSYGGKALTHDKFAYVGDKNDTSTWHLPTDTPGRAQAALSRINQTQGIPAEKKAGVLNKVRHAAKQHGIDVDTPSTGQKKWAGKVAAKVAAKLGKGVCPHCASTHLTKDLKTCTACGKSTNL